MKKLNSKAKSNQPNRIKVEKKRSAIKKQLKRVEKKILNPSPNIVDNMKGFKLKKNSLNRNPLFANFINWKGDKNSIEFFMDRIINSFDSERDKAIVKRKVIDEDYLDNLSSFQLVFKRNVYETINNKSISEDFLSWLNNAFNYIDSNKEEYINDEIHTLSIVNENGRWFEAIVCYNFIMTFNYFGLNIFKVCPICSNFFCHKGPFAKYCSEGCKDLGIKK